MKSISKFVVVLIIGVCCSVNVMGITTLSQVQSEFNAKVLELLENNDLEQLKEYTQSIPDCVEPGEENETPEICTNDRTDGRNFLWHIWKKGLKRSENVIEIDAGIYTALGVFYRKLYKAEPTVWNRANYYDFYKRYKNTWLQDNVELMFTQLWQRGSIFKKWDGFSGMTGRHIYTTLYISSMLGFDSMYKYVSSEIRLDKDVYGGGKNWLRSILYEMKQKSDEFKGEDLLLTIKRDWLDSILIGEFNAEERNYYKGVKTKRMFEMLNEKGWDMFMEDGLEPSKWEKHAVTLNIRACPKVHKAEVCKSFEKGAIKYGFYIPPEVIEEQLEQKLIEAVNRTSGKFDKGHFNPSI